jgi:hypothetical protein
LFTAVPFSAMLFMWMAWLNVQPRREAEAPVPLRAAHPAEPRLAYRHA